MTYAETLDYLFTQLPMYQRQGATAMKKDLSNIVALLDWLGNPQEKLKCIHVAGTNGKGSVCHLIAAALQHQGYRVGMYTSPHYKDFRERIKINGVFISEAAVIDFTQRLRASDLPIEPSFFEITVAMAFDYFAKESLDFCLIEVGLGGRLDSTNIITPLLSVITNIGLDHTQFLGETLPEIAAEKAGIIKQAVPVIIGRRQIETGRVFNEVASRKSTDLTYAEDVYQWAPDYIERREGGYPLMYTPNGGKQATFFRSHRYLTTPAQRENGLTAAAAIGSLRQFGYAAPPVGELDAAWENLSEKTAYMGRFQRLPASDGLLRLVDSAHNEDGIKTTMEWLVSHDLPLYIVLGMVSDKDHNKLLGHFPKNARYYYAKANIPRGLPAEELRRKALSHDLLGDTFPTVRMAYEQAVSDAYDEHGERAIVFVGGSIFTVAEVL